MDFKYIIETLQKELPTSTAPAITLMAENGDSPFKILIATVISLRTKDEVTIEASRRLFSKASTPEEMLLLSQKDVSEIIYPAGFYKIKAKNILKICSILVAQFDGNVPQTMEELLALPGVGRKTANLTLAKGFGIPAICVDTHVHRILNRIGFIRTKTPDETEMRLRKKVPKELWIPINDVFVAHGQTICAPQSPWCSKCVLADQCKKIGVKKRR